MANQKNAGIDQGQRDQSRQDQGNQNDQDIERTSQGGSGKDQKLDRKSDDSSQQRIDN